MLVELKETVVVTVVRLDVCHGLGPRNLYNKFN